MMIGLDFDGTCVAYAYPRIGPSIGAEAVLHELVGAGHRLVLLTLRTGVALDQAVEWFADRRIPLYGVNRNPIQARFSISPKIYARLYIDDAGLGCPLRHDPTLSDRPFVDWVRARALLVRAGVLR